MTQPPPLPPPGDGSVPRWDGPPAPGGPQDGPAYGQVTPNWGQVPPERMAHLSQPGIIPLRPLTISDIFGGALKTMRRNPEATIGTALIVLAVFMVPSLLLSLGLTRIAELNSEDQVVLSTGIQGILSVISSIALTGMIVYVVSEAVLGDRASLAQTWRAVRGRIPALIGTVLLVGLLMVVVIFVPMLLFIFLIGGLAWGTDSALLAGIVAFFGFLALLVFMVWFAVRLSLASAPVVLEKLSPGRAIARSWELTKGRQVWRILGITVLAGIVTTIFSSAIQVPLMFVLELTMGGMGLGTETDAPLVIVFNHLAGLVVDALVVPFTAGVTALLYLDQRIRRESLDVGLIQAAQQRAEARHR